MNILGSFLDDERRPHAGRDDDEALFLWLSSGQSAEKRLLSFDRWSRAQLTQRLDWAWAGAQKEKRIEQCRLFLEGIVIELWKRHWLLDGRRLAAHIERCLDRIGTYQRTGKVDNFWAYYQACVRRYVGVNSEEIAAEAMSIGAHHNQLFRALGLTQAKPAPTLPELIASRQAELKESRSLRARIAAEKALEKRLKEKETGQKELL